MKKEINYGEATHCELKENWEELIKDLVEEGQQIIRNNPKSFFISYLIDLGEFYDDKEIFRTSTKRILVYKTGVYYSADCKYTGGNQEVLLI